jgi:hypothetical protein
LTENCDATTGLCACNQDTSFGCDTEIGEQCTMDDEGSFICSSGSVGDGSFGSQCSSDSECESGSCYRDPQIPQDLPGFCVCDVTSNAGCEGDFICASGGDLLEAQLLADAPPGCYLPFGATCEPNEDTCLTGVCDVNTNTCVCNLNTGFPCNEENNEICITNSSGINTCIVREVGDGSIGSDCIVNDDCDSGSCYYGFMPPEVSARCTCNPESGFGCDGDLFCASPEEIIEIYGITDQPPDCYLPFGASCDPENDLCITGNCDENTNTCACSPVTMYPCDTENGETCLLSDSGSYVCEQAPAGPPPNDCPEPSPDIICTAEYAPVNCGGCEYSNQCIATSADPSFTEETCTLVTPPTPLAPEDCPPLGDVICAEIFMPVDCNGCRYSNQCFATGADPSFTEETCTLVNPLTSVSDVCPKPNASTPCTLEELPVDCGGCEYANQCVATSADPSFTSETCTLVTLAPEDCPPLGGGICPALFMPVECNGCRYSNQCVATDADPSFTEETCTLVTDPE